LVFPKAKLLHFCTSGNDLDHGCNIIAAAISRGKLAVRQTGKVPCENSKRIIDKELHVDASHHANTKCQREEHQV
jgi:hypothetical protein